MHTFIPPTCLLLSLLFSSLLFYSLLFSSPSLHPHICTHTLSHAHRVFFSLEDRKKVFWSELFLHQKASFETKKESNIFRFFFKLIFQPISMWTVWGHNYQYSVQNAVRMRNAAPMKAKIRNFFQIHLSDVPGKMQNFYLTNSDSTYCSMYCTL